MWEFLNKKWYKLTIWQWGLIFIGLIIILFNFGSFISALKSIFMIFGVMSAILAVISWLTSRLRLTTKLGIVAGIFAILSYIFGKIGE